MANRWGNNGNCEKLYFLGLQNHCRWAFNHETKRWLLLRRKAVTNLDSILKNRDIMLPTKVHLIKAIVFPVVMYGCKSWTERKLSTEEFVFLNCGVGEDSWESLRQPEVPISPYWNQSWMFIGRTDAEAETPILWPPDVKSWLIWKDPDTWERLKEGGDGNNIGWEVGWHHRLNEHGFE